MKQLYILLFTLFTVLSIHAQDSDMNPIFNGESFDGWTVPDDNIWWTIDDGIITAQSGPDQKGSILWTDMEYTDFVIELDFKMGDGTVDSGVFLRSESQQIQIGISGSLKRDMTCSPYIPGKGYPLEAEGVKDLLDLEGWNKIKIKAVANVYTIWLNGKQVNNYASEDVPEKGPIGIQLHPKRDMSIFFKNINLSVL